jgi:hypothetical protein
MPERPFADKRPVGPFAQSGDFADRFLGNEDESTFSPQDEGVVLCYVGESTNTSPREAADAVEFFLENDMQDFVGMFPEMVGAAEDPTRGGDMVAGVVQYAVADVPDTEVTVSQVEDAIDRFLRTEGLPANRVTIHNTSMGV